MGSAHGPGTSARLPRPAPNESRDADTAVCTGRCAPAVPTEPPAERDRQDGGDRGAAERRLVRLPRNRAPRPRVDRRSAAPALTMMVRRIVGLGLLMVGPFGPIVAAAETRVAQAPEPFRFEVEEAATSHRGPGVEGYLHNSLPWRITNVRLRVESVDPAGKVIGEASGWVLGDVAAGGRGDVFVPVSSPARPYPPT